jgi:hypothetical protein
MDARTRMRIMVGISTAVLLGSALFVVLAEGVNAWTVASFTILALVAVLALFYVVRAMGELRSGMPLEDERSRSLNMRAGYHAFYVSMYSLLALAFVASVLDSQEVVLPAPEMLFVAVALMGSLHIGFSTYYNRKGKVASE